jgi:myo-inositol-1(or 4)-monophosphatase
MLDPPSLAALAPAVAAAAREAGALAMASFRAGGRTAARTWSKEGGSPVTEADLAVDRLLRERLAALAPGLGWLSEEAEIHPAEASDAPAWIVDPIDGTRAFMAGESWWCVSVALAQGGRPVLGCLYLPAFDRLFPALAGAGATLDGAPLPPPGAAALAAGPKPVLDRFLAATPGFGPHARIPSLAARIAGVAEGRLAVAIASRGAHAWDVAAADLIVAEAGGRLTGLDGRALRVDATARRYGDLIATLSPDHDAAARALGAALGEPGADGAALANQPRS